MSLPSRGSVVKGTLDLADLIPALHAELYKIAPRVAQDLAEDVATVIVRLAATSGRGPSDDAEWIFGQLVELLDINAPVGLWFGPHPGASSDFGFWSIDEMEA